MRRHPLRAALISALLVCSAAPGAGFAGLGAPRLTTGPAGGGVASTSTGTSGTGGGGGNIAIRINPPPFGDVNINSTDHPPQTEPGEAPIRLPTPIPKPPTPHAHETTNFGAAGVNLSSRH